jgi:hypothetical protein
MMQDMRGVDLAVGDTIVYAYTQGSSAYLRVGTILEFKERKQWNDTWLEKARVQWTESGGYGSPKISEIEFTNRALKL